MEKEIFIEYLRSLDFDDFQRKKEQFELYYKELLSTNEVVNLFSRKTVPEKLWTLHFLDSIMVASIFSFSKMKVLDFGTGGGFPGIPIQILFPSSSVYLLDSKLKKINAIESISKKLDIECKFLNSRLEELDFNGFFDVIVSRSVKIELKYKKKLFKLLKPKGRIILYKSQNLDDIMQFKDKKIYDVSHPEVGTRKIVEIKKYEKNYIYC